MIVLVLSWETKYYLTVHKFMFYLLLSLLLKSREKFKNKIKKNVLFVVPLLLLLLLLFIASWPNLDLWLLICSQIILPIKYLSYLTNPCDYAACNIPVILHLTHYLVCGIRQLMGQHYHSRYIIYHIYFIIYHRIYHLSKVSLTS